MRKLLSGFLFSASVMVHAQSDATIAGFKKADLEKVLELTGVTYDGTFSGLVQATQKAWLRPGSKERWELAPLHEDKRDQLLPLFRKMWLVDEWIDQRFTYNYIFFMGAWVGYGMEERMETLRKLLAIPVHADSIVILSGSREVTERERTLLTKQGWQKIPSLEVGLYPRLFKENGLPFETMVLSNAPATKRPDGTWYRPTTAGTVNAWLQRCPTPQPGIVLVVSNQPFCNYQQVVVESLLPKGFSVRTVGKKAPTETPVAVYLDTIARTLYQWQVTGKPLITFLNPPFL